MNGESGLIEKVMAAIEIGRKTKRKNLFFDREKSGAAHFFFEPLACGQNMAIPLAVPSPASPLGAVSPQQISFISAAIFAARSSARLPLCN